MTFQYLTGFDEQILKGLSEFNLRCFLESELCLDSTTQ